jgi:hypothetical protein
VAQTLMFDMRRCGREAITLLEAQPRAVRPKLGVQRGARTPLTEGPPHPTRWDELVRGSRPAPRARPRKPLASSKNSSGQGR